MIEIIKIILPIKVIIITIIRRTITIKCRGRHRMSRTTNTELLVILHNGWKPLSNIKKSFSSDAVRVLYTLLKRLIHRLTWYVRVNHAAWILCLELSPTWLLKTNCNGNINQHNSNNNHYNNNKNDNNNNNNNNSNNINY